MLKNIKEEAVKLRKQGLSYREIIEKTHIAKSTLSNWLYDVGLSKRQKQRLTEKRRSAALRGATKRKLQRIEITKKIKEVAAKEVAHLTERELWLMGIMLYWAEGAKEKEYHPSTDMKFGNSDPRMIVFFIQWLQRSCKIEKERIAFELYIHKNREQDTEIIRQYWAQQIKFPLSTFSKIYYKRGNDNTKRRNTGNAYHGLVRIRVKRGLGLVRKIAGWIEKICKIEHCGVV